MKKKSELEQLKVQLAKLQAELDVYRERYELIVESSNDGIWDWDVQSDTLYNSPRWKETLGFQDDELAPTVKTWSDQVHPDDLAEVMGQLQAHLEGKLPCYRAEYRMLTKQGGYIWVLDRGLACFDENGQPKRVAGSLTDISERKNNEEKLAESAQLLRTVLNCMSEGILVLDQDAKFIYSNPSFSRLLGLTVDQVEGRTPLDPKWRVIHEDGSPYPGDTHPSWVTLKTGKPIHDDVQGVYTPDGTLSWILANSVPMFRPGSKEISGVVVTFTDITGQRKAQEEIQRSKESLSFALQGANSGIWDWNIPNHTVYYDENFYTMAGYQPDEFPGGYEEWKKRVHQDDIAAAEQAIGAALENTTGAFSTEFRFRTKTGEWMWILGQGKVIERDEKGVPIRLAGINTDINEKKRAEQAFQTSESRLASLLRVAPTGIGMVINRVMSSPNQKLSEMTGYSIEELTGMPSRKLYPSEAEFESVDQEKYRQISLFGTGTVETVFVRKDGKHIDVLLSSTPINADDLSEGVTFTALDITEWKNSEKALRESEENLRTVLDSIGDAVIATDFQQRVINFNPLAAQLTGWSATDALGKGLNDVFHLYDAKTSEPIKDIANNYSSESKVHTFSHSILKCKTGTEQHIACSIAPIKDLEGSVKGVVLVFRDIAGELRTREELQRMQTLESLGILAGGIAHDFNNILMGLFGNIAMAKRKLNADHPSYSNLQKAEVSAERAKNLTGKLLTFAKGGEPIRDHVSLAELVKDVALFDLSGSNVKLTFDHPDDLWTANVDKGQIQQVFSNLTTNANQAMPDGGELQISLQNLDNRNLDIESLGPGKYIKAIVKDNGKGINQKDLAKIFDPYFSTKQTGSGLGLATVYSIINKHEGLVEVTSSPGAGTTFRLFIPATDAVPSTAEVAEEQTTEETVAHARILVMDDEVSILELASEMLETLGHSVTCSSDSQEATSSYQRAWGKADEFDLVILDLTIPGGPGGLQTVKEILAINPEAKVLVASGYAEDPIMSRCEDYGFKGVIVKPYSLKELQEAVEKALAV